MSTQESTGQGGRGSYKYLAALTLGALGVVYGDIGTSPLYAVRECFFGPHAVALTHDNILGVLSLIVWTLISVVSFKYILYVMRADNRGEGGMLALLALLQREAKLQRRSLGVAIFFLGMFGTGLLYGDGVITPAISVLSAVEGLEIAAPGLHTWVVPITLLILVLMFAVQYSGTAKIGLVFGPFILLWFLVLAILGIGGILHHPAVLWALSPTYAIGYFLEHGFHGISVLGAVFLVATGAEALYADMGHFGKRAIRTGWFAVVLPGLLLNYFGQGALLLSHGDEISNPFYELAPGWALYPLIFLATCATVIASQALISGAFSLTRQAVQLGFLPRMYIAHTSSREIGQIYVPIVNTLLLLGTIFLVVEFRTSSALASAYGLAVSFNMLITTLMVLGVAHYYWKWTWWEISLFGAFFIILDLSFFSANVLKFFDGGYVPVAIGLAIFTIMTTWTRGRQILADRLREQAEPIDEFFRHIQAGEVQRIPGTAVFMARDVSSAPTALLQNTRHNKVIHQRVILLRVLTEEQPYVPEADRVESEHVWDGFFRVTLRYGFMEAPDVPAAIKDVVLEGEPIDLGRLTYFLGREIILATDRPGMAIWRERLFSSMTQLALRATAFFEIPSDQVIEIGTQVEM